MIDINHSTPFNERMKNANKLMKDIQKKFGVNALVKGDEAVKNGLLKKLVLQTPSVELNKALHCGGLSGIVDLFGPEASGKTSLAIEVLAKAQREDPEFIGAWLETEESITEEVLSLHGVDLSRLIYWNQQTAGNAENALDILRKLIYENVANMYIINSVAGLSPKVEVEDDLSKQNPAVTARIMSKLFRTIMNKLDLSQSIMIFINQERDNIGQMFGNPAQATGGKALKFYSFQRIRMSRLKLQAGDPIKEDEGIKIGFNIYKNRFGGQNPYMKGEFYARFDTGIDSYIAIPAQLVESGIVQRNGSWYSYLGPNNDVLSIGGIPCKFNSTKAFVEALRSSNEMFEYFSNMLSGHQMSYDEIEKAKQDDAEGNEFNQEYRNEIDEDSNVDGFPEVDE